MTDQEPVRSSADNGESVSYGQFHIFLGRCAIGALRLSARRPDRVLPSVPAIPDKPSVPTACPSVPFVRLSAPIRGVDPVGPRALHGRDRRRFW